MLTLAMNSLFAISTACFFGLFLVALAIAKHIGSQERRLPPAEQELLSEHTRLRPGHHSHLPSEIAAQTSRTLMNHKQPDWRFLVSNARTRRNSRTISSPPQSTSTSAQVTRRPDWAYFNQDLGDLSDPYQPSESQQAAHRRRR